MTSRHTDARGHTLDITGQRGRPQLLVSARRALAELHRGDQFAIACLAQRSTATRQETSAAVFRTDNKSWSSCGAELSKPSEAHRVSGD